jgi:alkanesulfonate monooxygenase SsuD/methylene tetrahydromethanopterin reductase-like flavin-dependent oxidoreductase (luciferase family)
MAGLIFGVGVGYLEPEFRALGAPFEERGRVTDEYLAAIRAIWTEAAPAYRGRFAAFERVQAHPQPVQKPTPPIVIGGHTKAAFRRAIQQGHGWYGFALDTAATTRCLEGLREAAASVTRPPELPPLEISVSPRGRIDRAAAHAFAALGVHRLVLIPPRSADAAGLEEFVAGIGSDLVGQV